jgi:sugar phosphate isomerase/epimerase
MKLGISSYTYGWAIAHGVFDENSLLDCALDFGVSLLQIGDNLPLHAFSAERLQSLKSRANQNNIELEIGAKRLTPENIQTYSQIAQFLNAKILRFVVDDKDFHPSPDEVVQTLRDSLGCLDNTILGIENHDRFTTETLRDILDKIGSDRVGICLDTANSLGAGEGLNEVVRVLAPFTVNLHIKDFTVERVPYLMGFEVKGAPTGSGFVDVAQLLDELKSFARCHTAILETWVPPENEQAATIEKEARWAQQSMDYLQQFEWS